jgi:Holliday junction resolvase RusA-like endonuclease
MKLKLVIEGTPKINKSIHYTKKGIEYKPVTSLENEKYLRASIISLLPYEFKPFCGSLRINTLHFVFAPIPSLNKEQRQVILRGGFVNKSAKPRFTDCLNDLFKAMLGTVFNSDTQICEMTDVKKYFGAKQKIEIELEEL